MLFKMLFGMSVIIWHSQQAILGFIFQNLCFKKGQFEPSVAYKSAAYKKKSVYTCTGSIEKTRSLSVFFQKK